MSGEAVEKNKASFLVWISSVGRKIKMAYNSETGMYQGFIYCITNNINGKKYIGQTRTTVKQRWKCHRVDSKHDSKPLYCAMRKYGISNFSIETIFSISDTNLDGIKESLNFIEQYLIGKEKTLCTENGYNITRGGDAPSVLMRTPVNQYDVKLNLIQGFDSISEASILTGVDELAIRMNYEHYQQTAGGYIWCRKDETPQKPIYQNEYNIDNVDISKYEPERIVKLMIMGWNGKRVIQYNMFGEIIGIYDDPLDASEKVGFSSNEISAYIGGDKHFNRTTLLYEGESFDVRKEYENIRPIAMYDMNGNFLMRFRYGKEADDYVGCSEGNVRKAIRSGSTCKGYYFSYYGEEPLMKTKKNDIAVEMLDENNNVVKEFSCQKNIAKYFNLTDTYKPVRKAIKNKTKYKGFYWRYKDEVTAT